MNSDMIKELDLNGETISEFSTVKYLSVGIQTVILNFASDKKIELFSKEITLGKDEAYTMDARECSSTLSGINRISAGWRVGSWKIIQRQDWIEAGNFSDQLVGQNPRVHTWGPVGSAPREAQESCIVDFALLLLSADGDRQAMVYLSDYPGLLCFTTNAIEIEELLRSYNR
jgi:hypothetical protein